MSALIYLSLAIILEVAATTFLKFSEGFSRVPQALASLGLYLFSFYFLSKALQLMPTGIAYSIWSGVGIVLISLAAYAFNGQALDRYGLLGITFIVTGVIILGVFSGKTL